MFQHVQVQQFPQSARHSAFMIFNNLIERHSVALKTINNEFVYGFTQVLDGEKDPRNLMAAFKIMTSLIETLDISDHVEVPYKNNGKKKDVSFDGYYRIYLKSPSVTFQSLSNLHQMILTASLLKI